MRISSKDLDDWARRKECEALLPELIRRLVHGSVASGELRSVDFPSGEAIQRSGFDGVVHSLVTHPFVPEGHSVWELSKRHDAKVKANEDYAARTESPPPELHVGEITYVQVTPRDWSGATEWALEKRREGKWKNVDAYDGQRLAQWLELVPAASAWLADVLGKPTTALALDTAWREWSNRTVPPLSPAVVRARRDDNAERGLIRWLRASPGVLAVEASDPREVAAFLHATAAQLGRDGRSVTDRAIVIDDDATLRRVAADGRDLIIVAVAGSIEVARAAAQEGRGHHILFATSREVPGERIVLGELDRKMLAVALNDMRVPNADMLARESGGQLAAVVHLLGAPAPEWDRSLAPLVLLGMWEERDHDAVARVAGRSRTELSDLLRSSSRDPDAPLRERGGVWKWISMRDAWTRLARHLFKEDLARFERIALEVLGSGPLRHSRSLRQGIVEGLAFLGTDSNHERASCAERVIRELGGTLDSWQRWAAIDEHLPLLAEAAPGAVLDFVEVLLVDHQDVVENWFNPAQGSTQAGPAQGVVWSLELLAWHRNYLDRAAMSLARLAAVERRAGMRDRALDSLREIFLTWLPHTNADSSLRERVLTDLARDEPVIGVELLVRLFPQGHDSSTGTYRPRYRTWHTEAERSSDTRGGVSVVELFVHVAKERPVLWSRALPMLRRELPALKEKADEALGVVAPADLTDEESLTLWTAVRRSLHEHRSYPDAPWAYSEPELVALQSAFDRLRPADALARIRWLFDRHVERPKPEAHDFDAELLHTSAERVSAIRTLREDQVITLAGSVEAAVGVGAAVAQADPTLALARGILAALTETATDWADEVRRGIGLGAAQEQPSPAWTEGAPIPAPQRAQVLAGYPFEAETWAVAERLGVETEIAYWQLADAVLRHPARDLAHAIQKLLDTNRADDALALAGMWMKGDGKVRVDEALLERLLHDAVHSPEVSRGDAMTAYYAERLFGELRESMISREKLALLEYAWFSVLKDSRYRPDALFEELARDPKLFVHLLTLAFGAEDEEARTEPTPAEQRHARHVTQILRDMDHLPGHEGSHVDAKTLRVWVQGVREAAARHRRGRIADYYIGALLARSPGGSDTLWPHESVRSVIEGLRDSTIVEKGFATAVFNQRGVFSKAIGEGGKQERAIAAHFQNSAAAVLARWPRTARFLRRVAESYEESARAVDQMGAEERELYDWQAGTEQHLALYCDKLLARGRSVFTLDEALRAPELQGLRVGRSEVLRAASRLAQDRQLVQATEDVWIVVPTEDRDVGVPQTRRFVGELMITLGEPHYHVGLLAAAAFHGAVHQQPQVLQVFVELARPTIVPGNRRIQFIGDARVARARIVELRDENHTLRIGSREWTLFELIERPSDSGGFTNVAEVMKDLCEHVDANEFVSVSQEFEVPVLQRAGWLLDQIGRPDLGSALHAVLMSRTASLPETPLRPDYEDEAMQLDGRWRVRVDGALDLDSLAS